MFLMRAHTNLAPKQFALAIVAVGVSGGVGTLLRDVGLRIGSTSWYETLVGLAPSGHTVSWYSNIPWVLMIINVVGVYLATRLLAGKLRFHDPNNLLRLVVITGFFGGFTSYSSLFVSLSVIWHSSKLGAFAIGLLALFSGVGAGWLGTRRHHS